MVDNFTTPYIPAGNLENSMSEEAYEPAKKTIVLPLEDWFALTPLLREGLFTVRSALKHFEKLERDIPQYPKPNQKQIPVLLDDVPITRGALHRVVQEYRDMVNKGERLLAVIDEERKR